MWRRQNTVTLSCTHAYKQKCLEIMNTCIHTIKGKKNNFIVFKKNSGFVSVSSVELEFLSTAFLFSFQWCAATPHLYYLAQINKGVSMTSGKKVAQSIRLPCRRPIIAGHRAILQKVQLHVFIQLLWGACVQRLRQVLQLNQEVVRVRLHGSQVQRDALRSLQPLPGGQRLAQPPSLRPSTGKTLRLHRCAHIDEDQQQKRAHGGQKSRAVHCTSIPERIELVFC